MTGNTIHTEFVPRSRTDVQDLMERAGGFIVRGNYDEAYALTKQAIAAEPGSGRLWYILGRCLHEIANSPAAILAFDRAVELSYNTVQLHTRKANSLISLNRFEEALKAANDALWINPESIEALHKKGNILDIMGDLEGALACYKQIMEISPGKPSVLYEMAKLGNMPDRYKPWCDPGHEIHRIRHYSWKEQSYLHSTHAIILAEEKLYDAAFAGYAQANSIIRENQPFERKNIAIRTDMHIEAFNGQLMEKYRNSGSDSRQPVFIVGMPRSGTTLIEQILSSHPDVTGAGELNFISRIEQQLCRASIGEGTPYPANITGYENHIFSDLGELYLKNARQHLSRETRYFTDKMPTNFLNLGLVGLLLPNARIIHAVRDPIDTCLSCYFIRFADTGHLSFSFDLEDAGFYYNQYRRLMKHWEELFKDRILTVQYEELLDDQEKISRKMIEYLELEWNPDCLEFYNNDRGVTTASRRQVRKPVYKSSAGRWKRYEKHLGPLIDILD